MSQLGQYEVWRERENIACTDMRCWRLPLLFLIFINDKTGDRDKRWEEGVECTLPRASVKDAKKVFRDGKSTPRERAVGQPNRIE